jgi:nucleoside-diphosphate-sugar epimerase
LTTPSKEYKQIIDIVGLSDLKGKSIFITGGTGFFGYWLLNLFSILNNLGFEITITLLSRSPEMFLKKNPDYNNANWLNWIKGDIIDYKIPAQKFDLIIHGAANTTPLVFEKPAMVFEEIFSGTKHVLDHTILSGAKRFLNISSGAVYGEVPIETQFITEDATSAPLTNRTENAYGEAKRASEMLAYSFAKEKGIEVITARCFAFAGLGIGEHLILNILIKQALHENEIAIKSKGIARRSFLHGKDLAIWLLKLLIDGKSGEIYNVGSDEVYTIKELAELVKNIISPNKKVIVLGSLNQEQRINYIPSIEKVKLLGLDVWTTLTESINEMKNESK